MLMKNNYRTYHSYSEDDRENGIFPFVTAGENNEGVSSFINNSEANTFENSITIDMFGNCFYHSYKFKCDDNILVMQNPKLNPQTGLFIAAVIASDKYRNSYGRQYRQKDYVRHKIQLPATPNGEPDWEYMDQFMKKRYRGGYKTNVKSHHIPLKTHKWKTYFLHDLYEIKMGNGFDKNKLDEDNHEVNLVSRISFDNGVDCKVGYVNDITPFPAGLVTVALGGSYLGSCFVQHEAFYTAQNVAVMTPKFEEMNFFTNLFLSCLIREEAKTKYCAFGRELNAHIGREFTVNLPQKSDGSPDWKFMENYIKSLPYSDRIKQE